MGDYHHFLDRGGSIGTISPQSSCVYINPELNYLQDDSLVCSMEECWFTRKAGSNGNLNWQRRQPVGGGAHLQSPQQRRGHRGGDSRTRITK